MIVPGPGSRSYRVPTLPDPTGYYYCTPQLGCSIVVVWLNSGPRTKERKLVGRGAESPFLLFQKSTLTCVMKNERESIYI